MVDLCAIWGKVEVIRLHFPAVYLDADNSSTIGPR